MSWVPQVACCSSTDSQWKMREKRKLEETKQLRKRREIADEHERTLLSVPSINAIPDSADKKVTKKVIQNILEQTIQTNMNLKVTMTYCHSHIRCGPCSVKPVQNHWVALRLIQPFILPRSIKWVPGISGNLVVKSKLPPGSGSSLGAVEPHP